MCSQSYKLDNSHSKDFKKACGAKSVYFDDKLNILSVIVSDLNFF